MDIDQIAGSLGGIEADIKNIKTDIADLKALHSNGGCNAAQRINGRVSSLFLAGCIVVSGFCGWVGWLTLMITAVQ